MCLVGIVFILSTHSFQLHINVVIIIIIYYYFLTWLNTYWVSWGSETAILNWTLWFVMNITILFSLMEKKVLHSWFARVTLIHITMAAVWNMVSDHLCANVFFTVLDGVEPIYITWHVKHMWPWQMIQLTLKTTAVSHFKTNAIQMIC